MCKSIIFIGWFFYSNHFFRQRKVSELKRLQKWFIPLIALYLVFICIEVYFAVMFINRVLYQEDVKNEIIKNK